MDRNTLEHESNRPHHLLHPIYLLAPLDKILVQSISQARQLTDLTGGPSFSSKYCTNNGLSTSTDEQPQKNKKLHEKQTYIELQANGFNVTCVLEWLRLNTCQRRNKIERRFCCKTIDLEWISTINLITQRLILLRIVSDLRSHSLSYHTFETNHKTKKTVNETIPHKPTKKKRISTHLPF